MLKKHLVKHLAYYAQGWYLFCDQQTSSNKDTSSFLKTSSSNAKIVIVSKQHYQESWQTFTAINYKELQQIINLQKNDIRSTRGIFQTYKRASVDGYEVKKTIFDDKLIDAIGANRILIPETELFEPLDGKASLLSLTTPVGELFSGFFANKVTNSYASGLVNNIETFKLSSGLPLDIKHLSISEQGYADFLFRQFVTLNLDVLFKKTDFNGAVFFKPNDFHLVYWAPLLTALLFYIVSNFFIWSKTDNIEKKLAQQGSEITKLLASKQKLDERSNLLNSLNKQFSLTSSVHSHWSLVYNLVESGMIIDRLTFNNILTVRGKAENAGKVLADIAQSSMVSSASFNGSVRKSQGFESFTLDITPSPSLAVVSKQRGASDVEN
jgi:hypothetical protein